MVATATGSCALCQSPIAEGEVVMNCPGCRTAYHRECWDEIGGCGIYGCTHVPQTEKRTDMEMPAAIWGSETKPCPACGREIQAMATRCRHCKAEFSVAASQKGADWRAANRRKAGLPVLRRWAIGLSVACAVPFVAPFAGIVGAAWWWYRAEDVATLPRLLRTILAIALGVAAVQVAMLVLILAFAR